MSGASPLTTPSLVTAVVDDLHDPVRPAPGTDHHQAVADAGCFDVVEVGGTSSTRPRPEQVRVVAANLERGRHLDAWVELFEAADADVLLLSEADGGMARSGNRYVARELADRLGMAFVFAVEFVELSLGGAEEQEGLPPDARNEFGVHGGAVLSRVGLDRPAAVRLEFDGEWYAASSHEPRVGGRCAVVATVGDLVVVVPHLESHGPPEGRAEQLADLLDLVEAYADGRAVVVGGDLNTHTLHLRDPEPLDEPFDPQRFLDPVSREPLFAEATARGYRWEEANVAGSTVRKGGANLDWFLVRGIEVSDPETIPAVDAAGHPISDHEVLALTVRLP